MKEEELAKLALQFVGRVNLSAKEIPAFVAVNNWLQAKAGIVPVPRIAPQPEAAEADGK